eukprot:1345139-Prymnesium_polylepis.1
MGAWTLSLSVAEGPFALCVARRSWRSALGRAALGAAPAATCWGAAMHDRIAATTTMARVMNMSLYDVAADATSAGGSGGWS